jgi:hypothetical protein
MAKKLQVTFPGYLAATGSGYDLSSVNHMHLRLEFRTEFILGEIGYETLLALH